MSGISSDQQFQLATLYSEIARRLDPFITALPKDDPRRSNLRISQSNLRNASTDLAGTGIVTALDELGPDVRDGLLDVVKDLKNEVKAQAKIGKVLAFVDQAVAIASAAMAGNVPSLLTAIAAAQQLVADEQV